MVVAVASSCGGPTAEQHESKRPVTVKADGIRRIPVASSALRSVGYDAEQQTLEIEFTNGAVYQYFRVPAETYRGLMAAESRGRYFHQHVCGVYRYERTN
jgi:hypothetical protein